MFLLKLELYILQDDQILSHRFYAACAMDVCAYQDDTEEMRHRACAAVATFAETCEAHGHITSWRHENFCRMFIIISS